MEQVVLYIKESYNELVHKVTWPSMPSLINSTTLVIIASLIIALLVFLMDTVSNGVLQFIYNLNV